MLRALKVSILFFSLPLLFSCKGETNKSYEETNPLKERIYRYPLRYNVDTLDPVNTKAYTSFTLISQIFDGLVRFDKDLNILPSLAKSWIISEDGRKYTFFLRQGVRFHNGREVKAEDFVYSLERVLKSDPSKTRIDFLKRGAFDLEDIHAIDTYTLEIILKEPYAPTLNILALTDAGVTPKEEVEKRGFGKNPIGTGPFKFKSWNDNEIILEANEDYFGGKPFLDRIVYKVFPGPNDKAIFKGFLKGELENSLIPWTESTESLKAKNFNIIQRPITKIHFYGFNNTVPPFDNKKFRQAISHAIDREKIIKEAVKERVPLANGVIPPGILGYTPEVKTYSYDPERARELLEEAGYKEGKEIPIVDFWTASMTDAAKREIKAIEENLSQIGIKLTVQYATWPKLEKRIRKGEAIFFRFAHTLYFPDPEAFFSLLFDSTGINNYASYNNPEVDKLIKRGGKEMDILKRVGIYREIERIILDDAPLIPIAFYTYEQVLQPYVKGFEASAMGEIYIPMNKVWFEER